MRWTSGSGPPLPPSGETLQLHEVTALLEAGASLPRPSRKVLMRSASIAAVELPIQPTREPSPDPLKALSERLM